MMHGREKSDSAIVAGKPTNNAVSTAAEPVERRAGAKGNANRQSTHRTPSRERVAKRGSAYGESQDQRFAVTTQGGSRMPELGPYGSVRGARGNSRPYRDSISVVRILTRSSLTRPPIDALREALRARDP